MPRLLPIQPLGGGHIAPQVCIYVLRDSIIWTGTLTIHTQIDSVTGRKIVGRFPPYPLIHHNIIIKSLKSNKIYLFRLSRNMALFILV
jgi:hypothetical protein